MCRIRHIVNKKLNYIVIMVTNIILIVTILGIFLGITNTSLIFGEVQQIPNVTTKRLSIYD